MKTPRILSSILLLTLIFATGCDGSLGTQIANFQIAPRSYQEIIKSGIQPGIPTDYAFPKGYQYENGCFGFAVKYIVEYKFGAIIDMIEAEKTINKPRYELWTLNYIKDFLQEYGLELKWYYNADKFFQFLEEGNPLLIQYKYPVGKDRWISHFVAVYSFDDEGVWISQSVTNKHEKIPYRHVFKPEGTTTQFAFAVIETFKPKTVNKETSATADIN